MNQKLKAASAGILKSQGKSQREIANIMGVSQPSVCRLLDTATAKQTIERATVKYLDALDDITEGNVLAIKTAHKLHQALSDDKAPLPKRFEKDNAPDMSSILKYIEVTGKTSSDILKGFGVLPSHIQNILVQQIYNDNRGAVLSPEVLQALGGQLFGVDHDDDGEVIECEGGK